MEQKETKPFGLEEKEVKPFGLEFLEETVPSEDFGGLMCPTSYSWPTGPDGPTDHGTDSVDHPA